MGMELAKKRRRCASTIVTDVLWYLTQHNHFLGTQSNKIIGLGI
jgi:hypothetical protein